MSDKISFTAPHVAMIYYRSTARLNIIDLSVSGGGGDSQTHTNLDICVTMVISLLARTA